MPRVVVELGKLSRLKASASKLNCKIPHEHFTRYRKEPSYTLIGERGLASRNTQPSRRCPGAIHSPQKQIKPSDMYDSEQYTIRSP
ncbi:hypothetical protein TNCV_190221 [Trichonephila clavipes]|nr:hypothetical protein TNCV_190221 [Trichonephila clavipes]